MSAELPHLNAQGYPEGTVAGWLSSWLAERSADGSIARSTLERDRLVLEKHVIPSIGLIALSELRELDITALRDRWTTGANSTARRPLARSTVQKQLKILRQALAAAVSRMEVSRNPAVGVRLPAREFAAEQRSLSETEIAALLSGARDTAYDIPIRIALATGIRQAELLDLCWDDVDLVGQTLLVRGTKSLRSRRLLELSKSTIAILHIHRQLIAARGAGTSGHALVFPGPDGERWNRGLFYRGYRRIIERSGLGSPQSVKWHTLRHTAASHWLLRGVDVLVVSRRLGHASVSFTMDVYAHLLPGQQRTAAEAFDELLCS